MKQIYFVLGILSLSAGTVGVLLPILPTTPFILLAAFFFSKSSAKFQNYLMEHKTFGPIIHDFYEKRALRISTKIYAVSLMWIVIAASEMLFLKIIWGRLLLIVVGISVSVYLLKFPTLKE